MDQTAPTEISLIQEHLGRIHITCPWCMVSEPEEAFIELQTPPNFPEQCGIVLKHRCGDRRAGHGRLFTIRNYRRPAEAIEPASLETM